MKMGLKKKPAKGKNNLGKTQKNGYHIEEPCSMKPSIKEITKIDGNTTSYSIHGIKANARIRVEQYIDLFLKNPKMKFLGQPYDEMLLTTHKRHLHYKVNEDHIIFKDELFFRKNYGKTGNIKYCQSLMPKQLVDKILRSLHGEFGKHPGLTNTIIAYRQKHYFPNMAQLVRQGVMSCEQCIGESRVNYRLTRPHLQNPSEHITAPENAMQIVLVPVVLPSGG